MDSIISFLFPFAVLIFSVIIHEVSHGLMAFALGDETAKREGRLTLNPISHIDLIGSIIVPLLLFFTNSHILLGWAKPVPYNPMALYKDFRYGPLKVALAGTFSNLALALVFGLLLRFAGSILPFEMISLMQVIVLINTLLFVFNMLPFPPLDGSKILTTFLPFEYARMLENIGFFGIAIIFLFLSVFPGLIQGVSLFIANLIMGPFGIVL